MNNPYYLHSWSKHYREEALQEAQRQHLIERERPREAGPVAANSVPWGRVSVVASWARLAA